MKEVYQAFRTGRDGEWLSPEVSSRLSSDEGVRYTMPPIVQQPTPPTGYINPPLGGHQDPTINGYRTTPSSPGLNPADVYQGVTVPGIIVQPPMENQISQYEAPPYPIYHPYQTVQQRIQPQHDTATSPLYQENATPLYVGRVTPQEPQYFSRPPTEGSVGRSSRDKTKSSKSASRVPRRGFSFSVASRTNFSEVTSKPWDIRSQYIPICRQQLNAGPGHIDLEASKQSKLSPFAVYYYDETAPNSVLLHNDVREHPLKTAKKSMKSWQCNQVDGNDTRKSKKTASSWVGGDMSDTFSTLSGDVYSLPEFEPSLTESVLGTESSAGTSYMLRIQEPEFNGTMSRSQRHTAARSIRENARDLIKESATKKSMAHGQSLGHSISISGTRTGTTPQSSMGRSSLRMSRGSTSSNGSTEKKDKKESERDYRYGLRKMYVNVDKVEGKAQNTYPTHTSSYDQYPLICFDQVEAHNVDDFYRSRQPPRFFA